MRLWGRTLLLLLLLVPSLLLLQRLWGSLHWSELAAVVSGRIATALPSTAYLTQKDQWLKFRLSDQGSAVRVRTNGIIAAKPTTPAESEWWYAFEYRLYGDGGDLLKQGIYHHRTRLTRLLDSDSGRVMTRNFLLDPKTEPTDGRSMVLYFGGESAAQVWIRPFQQAPELQRLLFRVYEKVPNSKYQVGYLWDRLGASKKMRLSRRSVYGMEFLREEERRNLLRYEWKAVGPLGVEDLEYDTTKLYIANELEGDNAEQGGIPFGLYVDRQVRGMVPLPDGDWQIKLEVVNLGDRTAGRDEIEINWYGPELGQRWQAWLPAASGVRRLDRSLVGGQLEIIAPGPLVVRAWGNNGVENQELTPQPLRLRSYLVDEDGAVSVEIDHVADTTTPFRVDIRSQMLPGEYQRAGALNYELLNEKGISVSTGELPVDLTLSQYDRIDTVEPEINVSEAARYYFELPPAVARVRFSSSQELLLSTYSRPPDLVRKVRVPEDYQITGDDQDKQPAWFLLRPADEDALRRAFRSMVLVLQKRPPETDSRVLAGDFDWELYQPAGNWRARQLLVPRREALPVRDQSLTAVFREIPGGKPIPVSFRGRPGFRQIEPKLLFLRDRPSPLDVQIRLGSRLLVSSQIAGRQGELKLPPVEKGDENLSVVAPETARWFINHAEAASPAYMKRLAMRMSGGVLEFDYIKDTEAAEVLSGELYTGSSRRSRLRVSVKGRLPAPLEPRQEWTFRSRLFDLQPETSEPIPVLNSALRPLAGRQRFFLPLGADLPSGRYRIRFELESGPEAYLTLYQMTPGQSEQRVFLRQAPDVQKNGV